MVMRGLGRPSVVFAYDSGCHSTITSAQYARLVLPRRRKDVIYQAFNGHKGSPGPVGSNVALEVVWVDTFEPSIADYWQLAAFDPAADRLH